MMTVMMMMLIDAIRAEYCEPVFGHCQPGRIPDGLPGV